MGSSVSLPNLCSSFFSIFTQLSVALIDSRIQRLSLASMLEADVPQFLSLIPGKRLVWTRISK